MRLILLFGFLNRINAQNPEPQSYPDNFIPPNIEVINKVIDVTFTHNLPNSFDLREEDDYTWSYFSQEFAGYGLDESEESRNFKTSIRDASFVDIKFTLTFNAESFRQAYNAANVDRILSTNSLNTGLGINMDGQDPNSSFIAQSNCVAQLSTGDTICGSRMMSCRETSSSGEIECSSYCSAENADEACGINGLCSQPIDQGTGSQPHVCSCDSNTWWTTGGEFGESRDPCKPVIENWLIIVIGILGFLLLILIIIAVIYCCIHGCKCPCESCCTCCDKKNDPQLQYEVKNGSLAAGIGNDAFVNENDNASHNGSQRPLYEKHLPEDKFSKNPAVWYENNFTKELHRPQNDTFRTEAVAETSTMPRIQVTDELPRSNARDYSTHDPSRDRERHRSRENRDRNRDRHRRERRDRDRPKETSRSKSPNPYTSKMEREIEKLQEEIEVIKQEIDRPPEYDETLTSNGSTIQAGMGPPGPIAALDLSDEDVDGPRVAPLRKARSKEILVPEEIPRTDLKNTLKDRWRVPALTVKPLSDHNVSQVESSVI